MAIGMKVSARYGSHMAPLLQAVLKTRGPVLELGLGVFSTHTLHYLCANQGRRLVTIENEPGWFERWGAQYRTGLHEVLFVNDWADAQIEQPWDVVLVDHSPPARRGIELARLAQHARYVIAHDANGRYWRQYGYWRAFKHYKYRREYSDVEPASMILSNFDNLSDFWRPA